MESTNSLRNWIIFASLSASSAIPSPTEDLDLSSISNDETSYFHEASERYYDDLTSNLNYPIYDMNYSNMYSLLNFTKKLTSNLKDVDSEIVKAVDDNFWDLV